MVLVLFLFQRWDTPERRTRLPVLTKGDWPTCLIDLVATAANSNGDMVTLAVYRGPHDDYFWRCQGTSELIRVVIRQWDLTPARADNRLASLFREYLPVDIMWTYYGKDIDYYVSSQCVPGGEWKGHQHCVAYDKTTNAIVGRYYYNF